MIIGQYDKDSSIPKKRVGVSEIRYADKEQETSPYPIIEEFNVETNGREHCLNIPSSKVIQLIKFGAINKQLTVQYCHYAAHLARSSSQPEDREYYASACAELLSYLLRQKNDLPAHVMARLIFDVSDTTKENALLVVKNSFVDIANIAHKPTWAAQLIGALYRFGLWEEATDILTNLPLHAINFRLGEKLVSGVINSSEELKSIGPSSSQAQCVKADITRNMITICKLFRQNRVQFMTKRKAEFIQSLKDIGYEIAINPTIKMSGRCVSCDTRIPLYDNRAVSSLNESLRNQIHEGSEAGLYLNTSPQDANRFENFLNDMRANDNRPIDCVLDGLNIAHRTSVGFNIIKKKYGDVVSTQKVPKPESQAHVLINTIIRSDMLKIFRNILVVGRHHMRKWPGLLDFFNKHNIHFYCSYNNSKDDLFQLFAATLSPKTVLVTNDFLRDHLAQLDGPNQIELSRWIDTHQAWIEQSTLKAIWPTPYEKIAHYDETTKHFHLPVVDLNMLDDVGLFQPPPHLNSKMTTWLCFKADGSNNKMD